MKALLEPIKTTVIGGFIFLIPVVLVVVLGAKLFEIMGDIARPLALWLELEGVLGVAAINLVTVAVTVVLCYLAGLIARSQAGARVYTMIDEKLLSVVPQYSFIKSMTPGRSQEDMEKSLQPVLVHFDDSVQMAFLADRPQQGLVTVFVPGAPNPWSGSVLHVDPERVAPMNVAFSEVVRNLRMIGQGASSLVNPQPEAIAVETPETSP
jgi:uncharacterized membrane protein